MLVAALVMTSCGDGEPEPTSHQTSLFGYAVNSSLATTNAASLLGVANDAGLLAARGAILRTFAVPGLAGDEPWTRSGVLTVLTWGLTA